MADKSIDLDPLAIRTLADDVFGDADKASRWFQQPVQALNGETPGSLMNDEAGRQKVHRVLTRIAQGVFS
ncbi:MAG: MbcA/ParS/Xre antitoxin family protein [Pseudomonadota bacterium]